LDHHDGTAQLLLGGLRYSPAVRVLLRYHGTLLITVTPGTGGRPGAINAVFTGDAGNPTLRRVENRWVGPTEAWDIKVERARIQVLAAPGRPVLCLRLEPPGSWREATPVEGRERQGLPAGLRQAQPERTRDLGTP
jgi:hypothetical protein